MGPQGIDNSAGERIAIIGMGCRFPGARNLREMWELLLEGKDAVGTYPGGRFPEVDAFFAEALQDPKAAAMASGGFLERIDEFDAGAFELSPREAMYLDPQHRLLLEVAWAALEDAGQPRLSAKSRNTGVFTGLWASDFENILYNIGAELEFYAMTGSGRAGASGRLSYTFGFEGPSYTVDAACSSSLVAVHMACQSLRARECDMALAGGANAILATEATKMFTRAGMLSSDGRCKFGDASADGFVRSEGAGMVVLKRLEDALADGDPIHAVIRGSAVSNDGRTSGTLMTPSRDGQRQTLHQAWTRAGVRGGQIRYFEAHGTGTSVGDPVEIGAIGDALRDDGATERCWIGSVKSNIGHTESAAGIAGVIKTVLALKHRLVPQSLLIETPNPAVAWDSTPLRLLMEPLDLADEAEPVLVAVSSFGLTGTNSHLVLEEFRAETNVCAVERDDREYLLPISARSERALDALMREYESFSDQSNDEPTLVDICQTASIRRHHDEYRAVVVCNSIEELKRNAMDARSEELFLGENAFATKEGKRRVVFIAPGQGSQWTGMARQLFAEEPVFKRALEECDAAILPETGWSLIELLLGTEAEQALQEIDVVQPALFSISVALAALWRSWGIVPDAVIGHSMGEVAAAYIAGVLSLTDAAAVICRRSRLMKSIRGSGAMLTVELPMKAVESLLREVDGELSIGASNSPATTVVSGDTKAMEQLEMMLVEREVFCRRVKVDVASHSSQVDPILADLRETLQAIAPETAKVPLLSTVTASYVFGSEMDADYWVYNLRNAVRYAKGIEKLAQDGYDIFVELSPHPVLLPSTEATLRATGKDAFAVASTKRGKPERREMLSALGSLYRYGCDVDWQRFYPQRGRCVALPEYPFQRERCWPDLDELNAGKNGRRANTVANHPLLGQRFESSLQPRVVIWEIAIDLDAQPYLRDHRVHGTIVVPASAQIEIVLEAMRSEEPASAFEIAGMRFELAMQIVEEARQEFQLGLRRKGVDGFAFEILGRNLDNGVEWTLHSSGSTQRRTRGVDVERIDLDGPMHEAGLHLEKRRHYRLRTRAGIDYGPALQLIDEAWYRPGKSLCRIKRLPTTTTGKYVVHPAVLDNCFQVLQYTQPEGEGFLYDDTYLPISIDKLEIYRELPTEVEVFCLARLTWADPKRGTLKCDLSFTDEQGVVAGSVVGLELQRVSGTLDERSAELLSEIVWLPLEESGIERSASKGATSVLIFADSYGVGTKLAEQVISAGGRVVMVHQGQSFSRSGLSYTINPGRREDCLELFADLVAHDELPSDVVHLWAFDQAGFNGREVDSLLDAQLTSTYFIPSLIQAIGASNWNKPPRLWMITGGGVVVEGGLEGPELIGAPMWGIGSVASIEHPELHASMVDLSAKPKANEIEQLMRLMVSDVDEDRIVVRGDRVYVSRFVKATGEKKAQSVRPLEADEEYSIEVPSPGILDNLVLQLCESKQPGPGEIAIEVAVTGLNFIDVTKAMGIYPGLDPKAPVHIGAECAGRVVAVGDGVTKFKVGDEVVAISNTPSKTGLLISRVCLPEIFVFRKPGKLTLEQAAALPIAYLTAHYSLIELAHIRAGEWVLIPAGAGGVGLAAIQIAHRAGAHVIATASNLEKQQYLRSVGVEHVFPSRTLEFAQEVLRITEGRGVDVVLNSLTGEYITKSLEVLKPFGRFIELGKRDIYDDRQLGLKVFRNNISYHAVDLAAAIEQRPESIAEMLHLLMGKIAAGELAELPVETFSANDPAVPFHHMAQGKHTGKIVVRMGRDVVALPMAETKLFRKDATYLISGGMGGVGSTVAEWMAENGAGALVLISRRAESDETRKIIRRIEAFGTRAVHGRTDIVDRNALDVLLAEVRRDMPPIAGIMHAATLIDDALIADLSPERFTAVMGPKVKGTWNLYDATAEDKLDFMVLFSSIAAVYSQPGHGSYAAANAFMDSFARYARANGRKVSSINWGGWNEIGLTREAGTSRSVSGYGLQGFRAMAGAQALSALRRAMETDVVQAIATPLDVEEAIEFHDPHKIPTLLRGLLSETNRTSDQVAQQSPVQQRLNASASLIEATGLLVDYLIEELGKVLKLAPERIGRDTLFGSIGLDSLMTLEFVRRLNSGLRVAIPTATVFNHPTAELLAADIAKRLNLHLVTKSLVDEAQRECADSDLSRLTTSLVSAEMSDDEALQTLMQPTGN